MFEQFILVTKKNGKLLTQIFTNEEMLRAVIDMLTEPTLVFKIPTGREIFTESYNNEPNGSITQER